MEAPVYSESEEDSDNSIDIKLEDLEDEVNINIHFHCEHCIKLSKCTERSKPGWSCDIINCPNDCGRKFHACKTEEHEIMCSHSRVPCLNSSYGCPHFLLRKSMAEHLPSCPASVVMCNAEWNRWAIGARERERVSLCKGLTTLYKDSDLDMALALHDQRLVNEMQSTPKETRQILCNGITRRFPGLPLSLHGSFHEDQKGPVRKDQARSQSTTDDDEEGLTPGLSLSVCTELLKGTNVIHETKPCECENTHSLNESGPVTFIKAPKRLLNRNKMMFTANLKDNRDDISSKCCAHGILKDLCKFCRNDPEEPNFKVGIVWRQCVSDNSCGVRWMKEERVEKVRKRGPFGIITLKRVDSEDEEEEAVDGGCYATSFTNSETNNKRCRRHDRFCTPPPAALTPEELSLEMTLKRYSRHQVKAKSMFTFLCMQEIRRDQFTSHYKNVHSEIQEGLDGWLVYRCPLHVIGCPFSLERLNPGREPAAIVYSDLLQTFGVKPLTQQKSSKTRSCSGKSDHKSPKIKTSISKEGNIMLLPVELLRYIAGFLDGFSLNNLSLTCKFLREVCYTLLDDRGIVIQEWIRFYADGKVSWKVGANRWFFPKSFEYIKHWQFKENLCMSNHLAQCPYNDRQVSAEKFRYVPLNKDEIERLAAVKE